MFGFKTYLGTLSGPAGCPLLYQPLRWLPNAARNPARVMFHRGLPRKVCDFEDSRCHCAVCEEELKRVWPQTEKDREAKIAQFAKANGF